MGNLIKILVFNSKFRYQCSLPASMILSVLEGLFSSSTELLPKNCLCSRDCRRLLPEEDRPCQSSGKARAILGWHEIVVIAEIEPSLDKYCF